MAGLHVNVLGGGVALARPRQSQIYFPIGDAVALRFSSDNPPEHAG